MMKRLSITCLTIAIILAAGTDSLLAQDSDSAVFAQLVVTAIEDITSDNGNITDAGMVLMFMPPHCPDKAFVTTVEAGLTARGIKLANATSADARRCEIVITDAAIIIDKRTDIVHRTAASTIHVRLFDASGALIAAGNLKRSVTDEIPDTMIAATDDFGRSFAGRSRTIIEKKSGRFRIASFIVIVTALGYYAFQ